MEDAPFVSLELFEESLGVLLGDVVLDASGDVVLPGVLDPLLGAGCVRLTSPAEEFVTVPLVDAALLGTQSVVIAELEVVPLVDADVPLDDVPEAEVLPFADARAAAESALVSGGVVPVPLAPLVVFRPVKR